MGQPVADDFGFLFHALLRGPIDWLGGGGSPLYWRPVSRQLYFLLLGPLQLSHPFVIALLHALLLAGAGVLLYRALRPAWPAPAAAAAGAFPILLEACRQLLAWASCAQALLALVLGLAALHASSRGRRGVALACFGVALLCKETAIAFAPALVLWPAARRADGSLVRAPDRVRLAIAAGIILAVWWGVHEWVSRRAGLLPPPQPTLGAGVLERATWALKGVWLDALSVRDPAAWAAAWMPWGVGLLAAAAVALAATNRAGRERVRAAMPWLAWGAVWVALTVLPLGLFMPLWSSHRSVIPAVGLGVAIVALVRAASQAWLVPLTGLRLVALLAGPVAPERIPSTGSGVEFDFPRLATLQRLARMTRETLRTARPTLPHGARIARTHWPRMSLFAFQDPRAFQVWYGDTTLRVVGMDEVSAEPRVLLDAVLEFEPGGTPQVARIEPRALRQQLLAAAALTAGHAEESLAALAGLEQLQPDTSCDLFMGTALATRTSALLELRRDAEAEAMLRRCLEHYPQDPNAYRTQSEFYRARGLTGMAILELRAHLRWFPKDADARSSLERLVGQVPAARPAPSGGS